MTKKLLIDLSWCISVTLLSMLTFVAVQYAIDKESTIVPNSITINIVSSNSGINQCGTTTEYAYACAIFNDTRCTIYIDPAISDQNM